MCCWELHGVDGIYDNMHQLCCRYIPHHYRSDCILELLKLSNRNAPIKHGIEFMYKLFRGHFLGYDGLNELRLMRRWNLFCRLRSDHMHLMRLG